MKQARKRELFAEMMEGVAAMKRQREGTLTLRHYKVEPHELPALKPQAIRRVRQQYRCSRNVFARWLFTNERTLEKWEQGRATPNPQAQALLLMAERYPDTFARLDTRRAFRFGIAGF